MILQAIIDADYKKHVGLFEQEETIENSIVLLGDSLINYWNTKDFYTNKNIINRGIPGDTTKGVLERLDQVIKIKPSIVLLNIGSNDITRYGDEIEDIVRRILQIKFELEDNIPNVKVYILSLAPVLRDHEITNTAYMKTRNNDIIDSINDELAIYTTLIDTNGCLKDENNNLRLDYTYDGLHLTTKGYLRFSKRVSKDVIELKMKEGLNNE